MSWVFLFLIILFFPATTKAAQSTPFTITVSPSIIKPNQGYTLTISHKNGNPYIGLLDYDLTYCPLKIDLSSNSDCKTTTGQWTWGDNKNKNGVITIDGGLNLKEGFYLVRYKPRGAGDEMYSNFELQIVEDVNSVIPNITFSENTIPMPPKGSYSILENRDIAGNFLGYTRIEVETDTDPNLCGGNIWRYTKTSPKAYWNPNFRPNQNDVDTLRWCVKETSYGNKILVRAIDGKIYTNKVSDLLNNINVEYYYDTSSSPNKQPALLGGFDEKNSKPWLAEADSDMQYHYMIYPFNRQLPKNLTKKISGNPLTLVNTAIGHPLEGDDKNFDIWHVEMFQPENENDLITFRQVEEGWANRMSTLKWKVTEDWTFDKNGLFTKIQQWNNTPTRCWQSQGYRCEEGNLNASATIVESYIPDSKPLTLKLSTPGGQETTDLTIANGDSYELRVNQSNGKPYSGFLEIKHSSSGNTEIWRDTTKKPIYIHMGRVIVTPNAYGKHNSNIKSSFSVRPYLANSSINGFTPTKDWSSSELIPNASKATFSNTINLSIGISPTPTTPTPTTTSISTKPPLSGDANGDGKVDAVDFNIWKIEYTTSVFSQQPKGKTADFNNDNKVNLIDYSIWRENFCKN